MNLPPAEAPAESQTDLLAVDAEHLWHPWAPNRISAQTLVAVSGRGCQVQDADGRHYLDAKASGMNATLGYGCAPVIEALTAQLAALMTYDMIEGANVPAIKLAQRIAGLTGPRLSRTFFCNSGSEAIETAVRIARFHHALMGTPERGVIVSLDNAYHGTTMAAVACSAGTEPVAPEFAPAGFVSVPGPGHDALADFLAEHAHRTAAMIVEPVQGLGGRIIPDAYLRTARELCDRHGVLLILDEVMTGFGRTGEMFAYRHAGIEPDILATSKGLTAGYISLAAVTTTQRVFDVFERDKEMAGFSHGHTHSGHAAACATGLAVIDFLEQHDVLANVRARSTQLLAGLEHVLEFPFVRDLRGRGLLVVAELDTPRQAARVKKHMQDNGVLVRRSGSNVIVAPPLIITAAETDEISHALVSALGAVHTESNDAGGESK